MAAQSTQTIGTVILLLLILITSGFTGNDTAASASCNSSHSKKCHLVRDDIGDYEFMMELEMGRMLLNPLKFTTPPTGTANRPSAKDCGRPPRYDSCVGKGRETGPHQNCGVFNRARPC